ncbi:hypothetical protein QCA50_007180 [Cerrena zonata]|uniref:Uncharacterized protein n=1 Tax=Cerrena zonata TaxID=2478898 RepID=A0AAW0GGW3_9APHY
MKRAPQVLDIPGIVGSIVGDAGDVISSIGDIFQSPSQSSPPDIPTTTALPINNQPTLAPNTLASAPPPTQPSPIIPVQLSSIQQSLPSSPSALTVPATSGFSSTPDIPSDQPAQSASLIMSSLTRDPSKVTLLSSTEHTTLETPISTSQIPGIFQSNSVDINPPTSTSTSVGTHARSRAGLIAVVLTIVILCVTVTIMLIFLRRAKKKAQVLRIDSYGIPKGSRVATEQPPLDHMGDNSGTFGANRSPQKLVTDSLTASRRRTSLAMREFYNYENAAHQTQRTADIPSLSSPSFYSEQYEMSSPRVGEGGQLSTYLGGSLYSRTEPPCYQEDVDIGEQRLEGGRDVAYMH